MHSADESLQPFVVPIVSLAPEPFSVLREIPILVTPKVMANSDDIEYVAQFVEANVGSTGDSLEEAIANVKDRLVAEFDFLDNMAPKKLGAGPTRQLAILREVIARTDKCLEEVERKSPKSSPSK